MEPRLLMAADPIQVGAVYVEEDIGSDLHGDLFYVTFQGGAPGTQLTKLVIDGDMNTPGFGLGDVFFDTLPSGLGADQAFDFRVEELRTANSNATVNATVADGTTQLTLDFTNFAAGDQLVFSIDVDEVQSYDPNETNISVLNDNFDPITSGVEFQNSLLDATFAAPHYELVQGQDRFLNRYDDWLDQTNLSLPRDNADGKRDRSAGAGIELQQVPKPISLAGNVFVDRNEDLIIQSSEQRLAGVRLELFRLDNGNYVSTGHTTQTDSQGRYSFGVNLALQPGTYQVRETQPSGYYSVGAAPGLLASLTVGQAVSGNPDILTQIELPLGDSHATDLNFAENSPGSIGGHVCVVLSGFDCFSTSSDKAPLEGVTIELRDASGQVIATQQTKSDGSYRFDGLRAGTYSVTEITPTHLLDGDAQAGSVGGNRVSSNLISQIILGGGTNAVDYDFCELTPSELSGHTFFDQNNNGRREPGEPALAGVFVTLWDEQGIRVAETQTNGSGFYEFKRLRPGNYRVTEQTPLGYLPGQADVGTIGGTRVGRNDATGDVISAISLPAGAAGINYDFGEILAGSIQGRVIADTNGNCVIDAAGDMPLAGVRIELLDGSGVVVESTLTDVDGRYHFSNLLPGNYSVRELQPAGYFHGDQSAGSGGGDDSVADLISSVTIAAGEDLTDYDFCDIPPASIAGSVYVDSNQDCNFDPGETPLSGVTISLFSAQGQLVATTTTDASGNYSFNNLTPGQYTVVESQPSGYLQGAQRAGTGGGNDTSQDRISAINLNAGADLVRYDFCELLPGSISGVVFSDVDFDCLQDPGENPISNVQVELLDSNGQVLQTTRTDAQGRYSFDNLRPGQYSVREIQPAGYFHGGQMAPASGGDDSMEDLIDLLSLGSGQAITEANFCEVAPAEISGYVFRDGPVIINKEGTVPDDIRSIRDGARTADDEPIASVRLQLRSLTGSPLESTRALPGTYSTPFIEVHTDETGYFEFTGLRAGSYHVYETHPEGYVDSIDTPGTTTGFAVNKGETVPNSVISLIQLSSPGADPGSDAILAISVEPGQISQENNFSEVIAEPEPPQVPPQPPSPPPPTTPLPPIAKAPPPPARLIHTPILRAAPIPLIVGVGHEAPQTWHLSVINGGFPRGIRNGEPLEAEEVASNADHLNVLAWTVRGLTDTTWRIVSTDPELDRRTQLVFDLPGSQPLAGDFNGDGFDELALFIGGEWFIDLNANGRWDESDIWVKLGTQGDQPVVGDWDGDGKDDVGIFGQKWHGDERALATETGLPDPENRRRIKPKNVPPTIDQAPDVPRLLQRSRGGPARADLIDHVFQFGSSRDTAITGDFNGDGIATIGIYRDGMWILDINGDGQLTQDTDRQEIFGQPGDLPLVGDFDGDGIDEIAIVRGKQVIVDSNNNGHFDATDQVFMLESEDGTVIVGDFDGDGHDEPALHQSASQRRNLARKAG